MVEEGSGNSQPVIETISLKPVNTVKVVVFPAGDPWEGDWSGDVYGRHWADFTGYQVSFKPADSAQLNALAKVISNALLDSNAKQHEFKRQNDYREWTDYSVSAKDGKAYINTSLTLDEIFSLYSQLRPLIQPNLKIAENFEHAVNAEMRGPVYSIRGFMSEGWDDRSYNSPHMKPIQRRGSLEDESEENRLAKTMENLRILFAKELITLEELHAQTVLLGLRTLSGSLLDPKYPSLKGMLQVNQNSIRASQPNSEEFIELVRQVDIKNVMRERVDKLLLDITQKVIGIDFDATNVNERLKVNKWRKGIADEEDRNNEDQIKTEFDSMVIWRSEIDSRAAEEIDKKIDRVAIELAAEKEIEIKGPNRNNPDQTSALSLSSSVMDVINTTPHFVERRYVSQCFAQNSEGEYINELRIVEYYSREANSLIVPPRVLPEELATLLAESRSYQPNSPSPVDSIRLMLTQGGSPGFAQRRKAEKGQDKSPHK